MYKKFEPTYTELIAFSFLGVITVGGLLLLLPISSADGTWTTPLTAFFTATSATCVTGLVVTDTYTHWSFFGQLVILAMIQIGGLGFMTVMTAFAVAIRKKIGLHERSLLMQAAGSMTHGGLIRLTRRIIAITAFFEFLGACMLSIRFIPQMGLAEGIWNAIFHSVSAFCNAGFDIMGKYGPFSSFTGYVGDPLVSLTLISLIVVGGIGFLVWDDIIKNKFHYGKYDLHTKLVLDTTGILILSGWVIFLLTEADESLAGMPLGEKILASLFQSITPRTAGFNTIDTASLSDGGTILTLFLMFIGGSPGSTAGGIKTTTIAVLLLDTIATATMQSSINIHKRKLDDAMVKRASAIAIVYGFGIMVASFAIYALEPFGMKETLFEVTSAVGTVGLSMGITPQLCSVSRLILMLMMFAGRVGGLSFVLLLGEKRKGRVTELPTENILIG
ncbi:MAG TPA: TrkH family potassium uptake protein [Oscillospiraceae bacterium]|nr:TrkH family potassium uptake protein [Oscillospiraceae bacterium]HRW56262.1 TrkH family potassium uptake protein [Oscillospiraceae bacterium]